MKHAAVMMTLSDTKDSAGASAGGRAPSHQVIPVDDDMVSGPDAQTIAAFDRRGNYIITGNGKGKVKKDFCLGTCPNLLLRTILSGRRCSHGFDASGSFISPTEQSSDTFN